MSGLSQFVTPRALDHTTGKTAYTRPTLYLALCTTTPTSASTGSTIVEPTSGQYAGYARQLLPPGTFNAASISGGGVAVTGATITFPISGGGSSGCTITGYALCDSATIGAGNMIWYGAFQANMPISANNQPSVPSGNLNLTLTTAGGLSNYLVDKLLDHLDGTTAYSAPSSLFIALCTTAPSASSTGASLVEPTSSQYDGYTRINIPTADWNAATLVTGTAQTVTDLELNFPQAVSDSTGCTVVGFALLDSGTIGAGNILYYGTLTSQAIAAYTTPYFAAGGITVQLV